ncbi:ROK family transcriptional regulator [Agrococcus sp. SGAir0287]|uniref:ROK family transcriptional regulator n=1 Tax=Agrococcus sp. SGAir0287 TaxID=2070347 RepID=UPI00158683FF|nr:ROK family transcriptional regulator [Agrococcus sp. SGAir0287]
MGSEATTHRNRAAVLQAVRDAHGASRAELAERTGLSVATVSRAVSALIDAGLLLEESAVGPSGGRPLGRLQVDESAATVLAVDVADRHTSVALVDLGGAVRRIERIEPPSLEPDDRLAHTLDVVETAWRAAAPAPVAIGVAIPGPVQPDGAIDFAPALRWRGVRIADLLRARIDAPIAVANDANLIAVAEARWGSHRDASTLVALAVFEGIGAGIVEAGRIVEGSRGFAGQIGRMVLDVAPFQRRDDDFGDLETQLGAIGLARRAADAGIALVGDDPFAALFARIHDGDAAGALAHRVLDEFAVALSNLCAILDPEVVVLSGSFAPLVTTIVPQLEERLAGRVLHLPRLVAPSTPHDGALLGAAAVAIDAFGPLARLLEH